MCVLICTNPGLGNCDMATWRAELRYRNQPVKIDRLPANQTATLIDGLEAVYRLEVSRKTGKLRSDRYSTTIQQLFITIRQETGKP